LASSLPQNTSIGVTGRLITKGWVCSLRSAMIEDAIANIPTTISSTRSNSPPAADTSGEPMPISPSANSRPATYPASCFW
jgi:hypothetical protein